MTPASAPSFQWHEPCGIERAGTERVERAGRVAAETPGDMTTNRQFGWMWAEACELLDRADRMQREFVRYVGRGADTAVWEPPVDIQENKDGLHFVFALPGVDPEQIEVRLEREALTVNAVRAPHLGGDGSIIRRLEIPHGRFARRVPLAGARLRLGEVRYVHGCLEVRLEWAGQNRE